MLKLRKKSIVFTCCWPLVKRSQTWPGTGSTVLLFVGWIQFLPAACGGPPPWSLHCRPRSASPSGWWCVPNTRTATRHPGSTVYTGRDSCQRNAVWCRSQWGNWSLCDSEKMLWSHILLIESCFTWKCIRLQWSNRLQGVYMYFKL